jgi:hypothetical protein
LGSNETRGLLSASLISLTKTGVDPLALGDPRTQGHDLLRRAWQRAEPSTGVPGALRASPRRILSATRGVAFYQGAAELDDAAA